MNSKFCVIPKLARNILRVRTPSRGGLRDFRFYGLFVNFLDCFLKPKSLVFRFWCFFAVSALFRSGFPVFYKTQIGFLDLLLDAVWCFFRFLWSEKIAAQRLQRRARLV